MSVYRSTLSRCAVLTSCLAVAACVRVAEPPKLSFEMPEDFSATNGAEVVAQDLDLTTWWRNIDDPQLESLVTQAISGSPDIAMAEARLAEARATSSRALRRFDPSGGVRANATRTDVSRESGNVNVPNLPVDVPFVQLGRTDTTDAAFSVAWEIDLFGRKRAARAVAASRIDRAIYEGAGTEAALAAAVADALYRVRGVAIQKELVEQSLEIERDALRAIDEKILFGLAAGVERTSVEVQIIGLEAQLDQFTGELAAGKRELLVLAGRATDPLDQLVITADLPPAPRIPALAPGKLLERRPDVRASKADMLAALGNQALAKLDLFPTFSLLPGIGFNRTDRPESAFSTSFWSLGLQGVLPILDRGRLLAQKRVEDARTLQAIANYEKTVQTAFGEADMVLSRLVAETRMAERLALSEAAASQSVAALEAALETGMIDPHTLRESRRQLLDTRNEVSRARLQQLRRTVQAYKALGGGWGSTSVAMQNQPVNQQNTRTPRND